MVKIRNKIISVLLIIMLLCLLTGCKGKTANQSKSTGPQTTAGQKVSKTEKDDLNNNEDKTIEQPVGQDVSEQQPSDKETQSVPSKSSKTAPKSSGSGAAQPKTDTKKSAPNAPNPSFVIEGPGVEATKSFTLSDLKGMSEGMVSKTYRSLGRGAVVENTHFKGVSFIYLLNKAGLKGNASSVTVRAQDGYTQMFTIDEVKNCDMIIAFSEGHREYDLSKGNPFRLVVAQVDEMDFNKQRWVRNIETIKVE
jgi:DMSO/TMAO reductase YedYZ molybdopterin-dependent catalytic subunit